MLGRLDSRLAACSAERLRWRKLATTVSWVRPWAAATTAAPGLVLRSGRGTSDFNAVSVAEPDFRIIREKVLKAAPAICARTMTPETNNPDSQTWQGVKPELVEDLLGRAGADSERKAWLIVASRRGGRARDIGEIDAFAFIRDSGRTTEAGRVAHLEVICSTDSRDRKGLGKQLLAYAEGLARDHFFSVLELSALNAWLRDQYYAPLRYVERDDPQDPAAPERREVYTYGDPLMMSRADLRAKCREQEIMLDGRSDAELRDALAESTWCGFRMTKDISATLMASDYEQLLANDNESLS